MSARTATTSAAAAIPPENFESESLATRLGMRSDAAAVVLLGGALPDSDRGEDDRAHEEHIQYPVFHRRAENASNALQRVPHVRQNSGRNRASKRIRREPRKGSEGSR